MEFIASFRAVGKIEFGMQNSEAQINKTCYLLSTDYIHSIAGVDRVCGEAKSQFR